MNGCIWAGDTGNPLKAGFLAEPCYNLVYLELAACRLMRLPGDFSRMVPNVRVLNLNYNFLEDPAPLGGLSRLRKLTIIGSRIKGAKQLIRIVRGMNDVEMIDFRCVPRLKLLLASFSLPCLQRRPSPLAREPPYPLWRRASLAFALLSPPPSFRRLASRAGRLHLRAPSFHFLLPFFPRLAVSRILCSMLTFHSTPTLHPAAPQPSSTPPPGPTTRLCFR